jgi:hypothetical protein
MHGWSLVIVMALGNSVPLSLADWVAGKGWALGGITLDGRDIHSVELHLVMGIQSRASPSSIIMSNEFNDTCFPGLEPVISSPLDMAAGS